MHYHKIKSRELTFPYKANSPTLRKRITFTEEELWHEIKRILDEDDQQKFTPGQQLYFNLLHCADINYFSDGDTLLWLDEFMAIKRFNLPVADNLDSMPYERFVIFSAIDEEYNACIKLEQDEQVHNRNKN